VSLWRKLAVAAALGIGAWLLLVPPPAGIDPKAWAGTGLAVVTIGLWATAALPEFVPALLLFLIAMLWKLAPASVVFSGFAASALWLVFGGMLIGQAVGRSGLGARLARFVAPLFGTGQAGLVGGVMALGLVLAFLMPSSMGRIMLAMPIVLALADRVGYAPSGNGRAALVLALVFGSFLLSFSILPANIPPMVMVGAAETLYGWTPLYGQYLLLLFPVLTLVKGGLAFWLILKFFPQVPLLTDAPAEAAKPWSRDEIVLASILGGALLLWVTDFVHHVSPAWIALGAGLLCILPGIKLIPPEEVGRRVSWEQLVYVAGVLSIGAIIEHVGLGRILGQALLGLAPLEPGASGTAYATMVGTTAVVALATTLPGAPAVMTPLAGPLAEAAALPVETLMMAQLVGVSCLLLPYQGPPMVVGLAQGGVALSRATPVVLAIGLISLVLLAPLQWLYWRLLGFLP